MTDIAIGRRERKKEETKQRIFLMAVQLFNEKGFDATTIDEIAERADVAKGTVFNYFPRKEALLRYLVDEWLGFAEAVAADTARPAADRIIEVFTQASAEFGENRDLARALAHFTMEQLCCVPGAEAAAGHQKLERIFDEVVRQGQERGEFRRDLDPFAARAALASVFIGTLMWWIGARDGRVDPRALAVSLPEAIRAQCRIVFDGLRPRAGH